MTVSRNISDTTAHRPEDSFLFEVGRRVTGSRHTAVVALRPRRPSDGARCAFMFQSPFPPGEESWRQRCDGRLQVPALPRPGNLRLHFTVSSDEEFVALRAEWGARALDMGVRSHHYLLVTLARKRLADLAAGQPPERSGWLEPRDHERDPMMAGPRLNLAVHRIRKQFAQRGVMDADAIIERRPRGPLRLGVSEVTVTRA